MNTKPPIPLVLMATLLLTPTLTRAADPAAAKSPNILFIAVDDLNDWITPLSGYTAKHPIQTPNFDRLASRGLLFTNAQCPAPLCNASRAALMTGIRPSTSGVYQNSQPWRRSPVLASAATLPQHLMKHGYTALGGGKIYHGAFPDPASWNDYFPSQTKNKPNDPAPSNRPVNGIPRTAHFDWGPLDVTDEQMGDYKVVTWASEQLAKAHDKPLFLAVGIYRPHLPWYVPRKYFDMYPLDKIELPKVNSDDLNDVPDAGKKIARPQGDHAKVTQHKQWKLAVQGYLASITFADAQLGRLLDALDKSPEAKNTIVVLWGDHGWHLGEKHHWRKFTLWEEASRVPLIMIVPGMTKPGTKCDQPVNLLDLYPTLTKLANVPHNPAVEGVSLLPQLKDPAAKRDQPTLTTFGQNNHALRSLTHRYIRYADGSEELYDHTIDPMEWKNLIPPDAAEQPTEIAELVAQFRKHLPKTNAQPSPGRGANRQRNRQQDRNDD